MYEGPFRIERNLVVDPEAGEIVEFEERQRAFSSDEVVTLLQQVGLTNIVSLAELDGEPATRDRFGVFVATKL